MYPRKSLCSVNSSNGNRRIRKSDGIAARDHKCSIEGSRSYKIASKGNRHSSISNTSTSVSTQQYSGHTSRKGDIGNRVVRAADSLVGKSLYKRRSHHYIIAGKQW